MVLNLLKGHETLAKSCHTAREKADEADDQVTVDLMNARAAYSEKTAWMLRATAGGMILGAFGDGGGISVWAGRSVLPGSSQIHMLKPLASKLRLGFRRTLLQ